MVVSGLPVRNGQEHAKEIAYMSLAILKEIRQFKIKHLPNETLKTRIGIHSGKILFIKHYRPELNFTEVIYVTYPEIIGATFPSCSSYLN